MKLSFHDLSMEPSDIFWSSDEDSLSESLNDTSDNTIDVQIIGTMAFYMVVLKGHSETTCNKNRTAFTTKSIVFKSLSLLQLKLLMKNTSN